MCQIGAKMLTDINVLQQLKNFYSVTKNKMMNYLITLLLKCDSILYSNIKTKQQSMQWQHSSFPSKNIHHSSKKFKQKHSVRKLMATVFQDKKGILLVKFCDHGITVTAILYWGTLRKTYKSYTKQKIWDSVQWDTVVRPQC